MYKISPPQFLAMVGIHLIIILNLINFIETYLENPCEKGKDSKENIACKLSSKVDYHKKGNEITIAGEKEDLSEIKEDIIYQYDKFDLTIKDITFKHLKAQVIANKLTMKNVVFINVSSTNDALIEGKSIELTNVSLLGCKGSTAIKIESIGTIDDCSFQYLSFGNFIVSKSGGTVSLSKAFIYSNIFSADLIEFKGKKIEISDCVFANNFASSTNTLLNLKGAVSISLKANIFIFNVVFHDHLINLNAKDSFIDSNKFYYNYAESALINRECGDTRYNSCRVLALQNDRFWFNFGNITGKQVSMKITNISLIMSFNDSCRLNNFDIEGSSISYRNFTENFIKKCKSQMSANSGVKEAEDIIDKEVNEWMKKFRIIEECEDISIDYSYWQIMIAFIYICGIISVMALFKFFLFTSHFNTRNAYTQLTQQTGDLQNYQEYDNAQYSELYNIYTTAEK